MKSECSKQFLNDSRRGTGANVDIALFNLACAQSLPGQEGFDADRCMAMLRAWTDLVRRADDKCLERWSRNPKAGGDELEVTRFLTMVTVLKHPNQLGIRYQPAAIGSYSFRDARFDFLPGVLMHRLGTCASLPVLFVAIGRKLGWPLSLAVAKRHVFCQWTKPDGTHLNLEGSCPGGGECYPDERYMKWPAKIAAEELASGRYLRPLTNAESFALFLETRGHCLVDNQRFDEASEAYRLAYRVAPQWSQYENHMWSLALHRRAHGARCFSMTLV